MYDPRRSNSNLSDPTTTAGDNKSIVRYYSPTTGYCVDTFCDPNYAAANEHSGADSKHGGSNDPEIIMDDLKFQAIAVRIDACVKLLQEILDELRGYDMPDQGQLQ